MTRHRPRETGAVLVAPATAMLAALFLLPMMAVAGLGFLSRGPYGEILFQPGLENFRLLLDPAILRVFGRSVVLAAATTALCIGVGYPLALTIDGLSGRRRSLATALVVLPSWMNLLVKNYAWIVVLGKHGLVNAALQGLGLVAAPLPLLYNPGAVLVGLVHTQLPFMVLPLMASLQRLDRSQVDAARDLGAGPWAVFRHVYLPGTRGGLAAGATFVFVASLGAFVTPDLLGGTSGTMIANLMQIQVLEARDWPFAAAMAWSLALVVLVVAAGLRRAGASGPEEAA